MHLGRDHGRGRVGAHAAGVGPAVAVEDALVVLARGERQRVLAVGHDDEARFLAGHELLDDDAVPGVAQLAAREHHVHRGVRFGGVHRDHDALACGQPVGLDHDRRALLVDVGVRGRGLGEGLVERGRDAVAHHEALGEILGGLELGGGLARAEDAQPGMQEGVDHAGRERPLRPHHGEVDFLLQGKGDQLGNPRDIDVVEPVLARGAGIARRDIDAGDARRLDQLPRQRVFAAAAADNEEFHLAGFRVKPGMTTSRESSAFIGGSIAFPQKNVL